MNRGGRLGLIVGDGRLPAALARAAAECGREFAAVAVGSATDPEVHRLAHAYAVIKPSRLESVIAFLASSGVSEIVMGGKVSKSLVFSPLELDSRFVALIARLRASNGGGTGDDALLRALATELESEGMVVVDQRILLQALLPEPGVLTICRPTTDQLAQMKQGLAIAKQIGALDIGQAVVLRAGTVVAVEAVEGTDECLRRGGALGGGQAVAVKVAKPHQDMRFDVPSIGPDTITTMVQAGLLAMGIEAGSTFIIERAHTLALADEAGLCIVALAPDGNYGGGEALRG